MELEIRVFCTLSFEAMHRWPDAPEEVAFLSNPHRHIFNVRAEKVVSHDDRDVEFILLKREIQKWIDRALLARVDTWSCERWASEILKAHNLDEVTVDEDGENGATVRRRTR